MQTLEQQGVRIFKRWEVRREEQLFEQEHCEYLSDKKEDWRWCKCLGDESKNYLNEGLNDKKNNYYSNGRGASIQTPRGKNSAFWGVGHYGTLRWLPQGGKKLANRKVFDRKFCCGKSCKIFQEIQIWWLYCGKSYEVKSLFYLLNLIACCFNKSQLCWEFLNRHGHLEY